MATTPKRKRARSSTLKADKALVAQRVVDFHKADIQNRIYDIDARLQRYAKFRMWCEGKSWPWADSSDAAIPDIMTASLRMQDTLHNAVMSTRPCVVVKSFNKVNKDKEPTVNQLLDYQFFVENPGEKIVGEMADAFVNDGVITAFVPWVKEERETHEIHTLPAIPPDAKPGEYFALSLMKVYPKAQLMNLDEEGWRWSVVESKDTVFVVDFYTLPSGEVEMDASKLAVVFDGPRILIKDYEDVLYNARAANLQTPSPSNPGGAAHVILVDNPTLDEIKRLIKSGFYDLVDGEEAEKFGMARQDTTQGDEEERQRDVFGGKADEMSGAGSMATGQKDARGNAIDDHKPLTRLMCFDIYDADGDGVNEDMIWWVLLETKTLLRARELTQVYPANPPRRPFAETSFIEVRGRRAGISLLEMMEGLHDLMKQTIDQSVDNGTITNVPWFFYRATSALANTTLRVAPGEGIPTSDPKNDVAFPVLPQQGTNFGFNMYTILNQMEERLTNIDDLQHGRVPQGKASALRTVRGMQTIMQQGEARPERILRRFFMCLTEIYAQMHELNQTFLPRNKQFRVVGALRPGEDPYRMIDDPEAVRGRFTFDFFANALNTSKEALRESLEALGLAYLNPLMIQLGIVQPDGIYQWARDYGKSLGQDGDRYLTPPSADSMLPKIQAEEAISMILNGFLPEGRPLEPIEEHMQKLMDFAGSPQFGMFTGTQVDLFKAWLKQLQQRYVEEQKRAMLLAAAQQTNQQMGGGPGANAMGEPTGPKPGPQAQGGQAMLGPGELSDESLPGAGGGANPQ